MELSYKTIVLIVIIIYTRPLWLLRYKFRSMVYNEKGWKINFRPWFWQEIKVLCFLKKLDTTRERRIAHMYRLYLIGFALLWVLFKVI